MNWIHYVLIYWFISLVLTISIRVYNNKKNKDSEKTTFKQWLTLLITAPFATVFLPVILINVAVSKYKKTREEKKKDKEEIMLKKKLGLKPDEHYLCFSQMGGAGKIECCDCGYQEDIISFVHGEVSCDIGRQCPNCHAFVIEHNESKQYHTFGESDKDFVCPKCGSIIRNKEEDILKGNDDPLYCPKCHSARLKYRMLYIT